MYFKYDNELKITMCYAENKDECSSCANFDICPLVHYVEQDLVIPHYERIEIEECPLKGIINLDLM